MSTITYDERPDLAPYAARSEDSRGRRHAEEFRDNRSHFQRDRDRIIHSAAFRRLEYKTQVFVNHEGDYYRTRLTHSIEVAQISRGIAKALRLNEELAEAIALAHDLGHTPFGHSGEEVLNDLMREHGGFEHNRHGLRVVEELEDRYPYFKGLNLTWELREGIIKHSSYHDNPRNAQIKEYIPGVVPTLEAQIINKSDEIAYNNHDIDDGITSGLLNVQELRAGVELVDEAYRTVEAKYPGISETKKKYQAVSTLINMLITDLVRTSVQAIEASGIKSLDDMKGHNRILIGFSEDVERKNRALKDFLRKHLYRHYRVERMRVKAEMVMRQLFTAYQKNPSLLPTKFQEMIGPDGKERIIADYMAGMTDRYALDDYKRLFEPFERT